MKNNGRILWNAIAVFRTIPRARYSFWKNGWISSVFTERTDEISSTWQESITRNVSWLGTDRGRTWKGDILDPNLENLEKIGCIKCLSSKSQRERDTNQTKNDESIFLAVDGTTKFSWRKYKFREPTLRREPTVRSEHLSGDIEGKSGVSQPAQPTDDAEVLVDLGSIQSDFIYRHHNKPRFQLLYAPKEEHSLLHWNILMLQVYSNWSACVTRFKQAFVRFLVRFLKIHSTERKKPPQGQMWYWWRQTKMQKTDRSCMYGQKYVRKMLKTQRIEKTRMGKKDKPKLATLENWKELTLRIQMKHPVSRKRCKTMAMKYYGISRIYETMSRIFAVKETWGSHCKWRIYFNDILQLSRKFFPIQRAMRIPDAQAAVDKGCKKLQTIPAWNWGKSKKKNILEAWRDKRRSQLCLIDWHMPPQKCRVTTKITNILSESCTARLRPRWLQQKMNVIARLSRCDGQAADAVSTHSRKSLIRTWRSKNSDLEICSCFVNDGDFCCQYMWMKSK